jgi:hypothetical protein
MSGERLVPVWLQVIGQFVPLRFGEAGAHADVLQRARVVEQTKQ